MHIARDENDDLNDVVNHRQESRIDMNVPHTSDLLYHFVGSAAPHDDERNWGQLKLVLDSKRISHKPHFPGPGTVSYTVDLAESLRSELLIKPTVTCFADIPRGSLGGHLRKYGRFGLGFRRSYLIERGARPVTYLPTFPADRRNALNGRPLLEDIEAIYKALVDLNENRYPEADEASTSRRLGERPIEEAEILRAVQRLLEKDVLAFLKPFDSALSYENPLNFYTECEWRRYGNLEFAMSDVQEVWVAAAFADKVVDRYAELAGAIVKVQPDAPIDIAPQGAVSDGD